MIHRDSSTPWGKAQRVEYITPWLTYASTSSHGGYKLDKEYNKLIPVYFRRKGGWYEEDCECVIIFASLSNEIQKHLFDFARPRIMKNWYAGIIELNT